MFRGDGMLPSDAEESPVFAAVSARHPPAAGDVMRSVRITVAVGLALLAGAIALVASGAPDTVARTSATPPRAKLGSSTGGATSVCQPEEALPAGTSAIRLLLHSPIAGPRIRVEVLAGRRVLTGGARGSGWVAGAVTVPVRPLARTVSHVTTCFAFERSAWLVGLAGVHTRRSVAARNEGVVLPGRVGIEYLRRGHRSWWSRAPSMAREMGLGHPLGGAWIPALVLALTLSIAGVSSWLTVRELR